MTVWSGHSFYCSSVNAPVTLCFWTLCFNYFLKKFLHALITFTSSLNSSQLHWLPSRITCAHCFFLKKSFPKYNLFFSVLQYWNRIVTLSWEHFSLFQLDNMNLQRETLKWKFQSPLSHSQQPTTVYNKLVACLKVTV